MRKEQMNFRQGVACVALFVLGSSLVTGGNRVAGRDTWIVILCEILLTLPLGLVFTRTLQLYPDQNFFWILQHVFGRVAGGIITGIMALYFLHLFALISASFGIYASVVSLPATASLLIALPLVLLSSFLVSRGVQVMGRVALLLFVYVLVYFTINLFSAMGYFHFETLFPILHRPMEELTQSAFGLFVFPFGETVAFLPLLHALKKGTGKFKVYASGLLIGGVIFAYSALRNVLMLGEYVYTANYYPSVMAISVLMVGQYLQHIEIVVSFTMMFCVLLKTTVCLHNVSAGLDSILGKEAPKWLLPVLGVGTTAVMLFALASPQGVRKFSDEVYPYYALPMQVALPLICWVGTEIKKRREKGVYEAG